MDQAVLVEQQQTDGRRLVEQMDRDGVAPSVAVWYLYSDVGTWRLLLAGPHLDLKNPEEAYGSVARSLNALQPRAESVSIADIKVLSPSDPLLSALRTIIHTGNGLSTIRMSDNFVNGFHIAEALAYQVK
jgi:hypothetical protein